MRTLHRPLDNTVSWKACSSGSPDVRLPYSFLLPPPPPLIAMCLQSFFSQHFSPAFCSVSVPQTSQISLGQGRLYDPLFIQSFCKHGIPSSRVRWYCEGQARSAASRRHDRGNEPTVLRSPCAGGELELASESSNADFESRLTAFLTTLFSLLASGGARAVRRKASRNMSLYCRRSLCSTRRAQ